MKKINGFPCKTGRFHAEREDYTIFGARYGGLCDYFSCPPLLKIVKNRQIEKMFEFRLDRIEHTLYSTIRTYVPIAERFTGPAGRVMGGKTMQTIYCTTNSFVRREGNVIDLAEYRSRMEQANIFKAEEEPLPSPVYEIFPGAKRMLSPEKRREQRRVRQAWSLDVCASLGVVIMTAAFTVQVLMG